MDEDLSWRKKEISSLMFIAKGNEKEEVLLKSIILLLYAHWEGYIKKSSKLYIKYISERKITLGKLCNNFKAVALKLNIKECLNTAESMSLFHEIAFMDKFDKMESKSFKININVDNDFETDIIDTQANLKPKVFKNIISILGLNYKKAIETREKYINSYLLASRNTIGHGSKFDGSSTGFTLEIKEIEKLKEIIISIIDNFRDELLEYGRNEFYLMEKESEKVAFQTSMEAELEKIFSDIEASYL